MFMFSQSFKHIALGVLGALAGISIVFVFIFTRSEEPSDNSAMILPPTSSSTTMPPSPRDSGATVGARPPEYQGIPVQNLSPDENFLKQVSSDVHQKSRTELNDLAVRLAANPLEHGVWMRAAFIKHYYNDFAGVRDIYEYLNRIYPNDPTPFYNLGVLYGYHMKQPASALSKYERAIALDPVSAVYHLGIASFFREIKKDLPEAERRLLEGQKKLPTEPAFAIALGSLYEEMGRIPAAILAYERGLAIGGSAHSQDERAAIQRSIDRLKSQTQ